MHMPALRISMEFNDEAAADAAKIAIETERDIAGKYQRQSAPHGDGSVWKISSGANWKILMIERFTLQREVSYFSSAMTSVFSDAFYDGKIVTPTNERYSAHMCAHQESGVTCGAEVSL